jgi:RNA polymerase sigma-70 factor, ECF subfamily
MSTALRQSKLRLVRSPAGTEKTARPMLDDSELLEAVRAGDPAVAGALYDRARPQIERTVHRLLGSRDVDGEDIGQVAALELITTIHRYRGKCSLDSWISTITARVVYKQIRRRKLERRFFTGEPLDDGEHPASHAGDALRSDLAPRVRAHLQSIDPKKAWAFLLHDVWGYELAEVGEITQTSAAAAQSRLVRARRDLHERIASDPELADMLDREDE